MPASSGLVPVVRVAAPRVAGFVACALLLTGCVDGPRVETARSPVAASDPASLPASGVLRGWDRARGRAYAEGDVGALRRLYVAGSAAGTSDAAMLRDYLRRGLRVEGMRMQVLALEVLHEDAGRLRLLVTDRLAGAVAVGRSTRIRLPRDQASTTVVELRRAGAGEPWRVALVRASSRRPAAR